MVQKEGMMNRRFFILILVISSIVSLFLISFSYFQNKNKFVVKVQYAPEDSTLTIDDKPSKSGNIRLERGEHTFKVTKEGWEDKTITYRIPEDLSEEKTVSLALSPVSDEALSEIISNEALGDDLEILSGNTGLEETYRLSQKYPFLEYLPIEGRGFKVGYGKKSQNNTSIYGVALYVSADSPQLRRDAVKSIKENLGINPSEIEIIYEDFINPFKAELTTHDE